MDELRALIKEKDEQVVSHKDMEAVEKKGKAEKLEAAAEEELEAKKVEFEKLENIAKQLHNAAYVKGLLCLQLVLQGERRLCRTNY